MDFKQFCDTLTLVKEAKGVSEKTAILKSFLNQAREQNQALFPVLRLLVPRLDRDRDAYKLKEFRISRILVKMLDLPAGGDRSLLTNASGDNFGEIVFTVLKKYIANQRTALSVREVNAHLDALATRGSDSGLDDTVLKIFHSLSARDSKWFVRIILKSLKIGVSDKAILQCIHEDGAAYYATNNNLKKLCETLCDPRVKFQEMEVNLFEPFRPMLSKRCDASNFKKSFSGEKNFVVEKKFDGERFQLHMSNTRFKYFSRNGFDFTASFGGSYDEGPFTPLLRNAFDDNVRNVILDGEMMLWNKRTNTFGSKGMNLDVKKLGRGRYSPCFCVFDVVFLNDKVLTSHPLHKRLQILKKTVKHPVAGVILVSDYSEVADKSDIVKALNESVDNNEEGIVIKDTTSTYKCGERNSGWFKMKMEYFDDVVHDLDVVVMGGNFGHANKINSFFVGISSETGKYMSLGRISSGLNEEQLDILNDKLKSDGLDFKLFAEKSQGKLLFGRDTPDVYIEPDKSLVLEIRATELIRTTSDFVKTPYTLRFPRVLKIRTDKPVSECLSINELLELTRQNKAVIKLNKRHIELSEIVPKSSAPKKIKLGMIQLERSKNIGSFLKQKKIHVLTGSENWAKDDIYNSIKRAGGQTSFKLDHDTDIVLVGTLNAAANEILRNLNRFDVVSVSWLRKVLNSKAFLSYDEEDLLSVGLNYRSDLAAAADMFGDSFIEETAEDSLSHTFATMEEKGVFLNCNGAASINMPRSFGKYVAYFDTHRIINDPTSEVIYHSLVDEVEFQYYDGSVCRELGPGVNLVVIGTEDETRKELLRRYLANALPVQSNQVEIVVRDFVYKAM